MDETGAVQCDQCGRRFAADGDGTTPSMCPSCGYALSRSPAALAAALLPADEPTTRPIVDSPIVDSPIVGGPIVGGQMADGPAIDTVPSAPQTGGDAGAVTYVSTSPPPADDPVTREALPMVPAFGVAAPDPDAFRSAPPLPTPRADVTRDLPLPTSSPGSSAGRAGDSSGPPARTADVAGGTGDKPGTRRRGPLVGISAAALAIVLLGGVGGTVLFANGQLARLLAPAPSATATPTAVAGPPAPPVGYATYRDPEGAYQLWVPTSWTTNVTHTASETLTTFGDATDGAVFEIGVATGASAADPAAVNQLFLSGFGTVVNQQVAGGKGTVTVSGRTGPRTVALAGSTWTEDSENVAVATSGHVVAAVRVVAQATVHNQSTLMVISLAPASAYQRVDTSYFSVMRGSLLLLAAEP